MSGGFDPLDDFIFEQNFELESQFDALEQQIAGNQAAAELSRAFAERRPAAPAPGNDDPLFDLKRQLEQPKIAYLLVLCPSCGRKNRVVRARAIDDDPRCGACNADLVVRE